MKRPFGVKTITMRSASMLVVPALLVALAGCEQRGPTVYVLEGEQTVELKRPPPPRQ